jgi:hypothetical protein
VRSIGGGGGGGGGGGMDFNWSASGCSHSVYECINAIDGSKIVKISSRKGYS